MDDQFTMIWWACVITYQPGIYSEGRKHATDIKLDSTDMLLDGICIVVQGIIKLRIHHDIVGMSLYASQRYQIFQDLI